MRLGIASIYLLGTILVPDIAYAAARDVFQAVSSTIYSIEVGDRSGRPLSQGSGVKIGSDLLVTNCHVIGREAASITLSRGARRISGKLAFRDDERDLCLVTADLSDGGRPAPFRESTRLEVGEEIFAIGAPLGLELTISNGIISSFRRAEDGRIVQITAPISPGSSGGGLFDAKGNLIGITTFQAIHGQNINFALPVEWIRQVFKRSSERDNLVKASEEFQKKAQILDNGRQWADLEAISRRRIQANPKDRSAWAFLTSAHTGLGRLDDALDSFERLISIPSAGFHDTFFDLLPSLRLGGALDEVGRTTEAIHVLAISVYTAPAPEMLENLWSRISSRERWGDGKKIFAAVTELFPRSSKAYEYLGRCLLGLKEYPSGVNAFRRAISIDPENEPSWVGLLLIHSLTNNRPAFDATIKALQRNAPERTVDGVLSALTKLSPAR